MNTDTLTTLALAAASPGTRLAQDVRGGDGQVLLTAGTVLTQNALEKLAARGVVAVTVARPRSEAESNAAREVVRQRLGHLFRRCDLEDAESPARQLFDAVLDRRLEDIR
jgi:hypothetical protein